MRTFVTLLGVVLFLAAWAGSTWAERPRENKEDADYILTGKVEKVFERKQGRINESVIWLRVREVHRGQGVKVGDMFYAYCFKMSASTVPVTEASGHDQMPIEGQTVKAYVRHRGGKHEANYPDWLEVVGGKAGK